MEAIILYSFISLLFLFLAYKLYRSNSSHKNLPPSPPSLPILGHLHLLKQPLHRSFHKMAQKYGPVMSLKFGSQPVVVVSSPSAVEECFSKNDIVLANRPKLVMSKHIGYNYSSVLNAPYGDHWRNLRRIGSTDIFSTHRLNVFLGQRKDEIKLLLTELSRASRKGFAEVELRPLFTNLTLNNIMRMVSGKRYCGDQVENPEEAREFKELIEKIFKYGGASNPEDFLPLLKWVTWGNFERKVKKAAKRMDKFTQRLIDEHRNKEIASEDLIDHLLSLQKSQSNYYTDEMIKSQIVVMLLAGTDTSAVTLEWAMSNLVNRPEVLQKAKEEIDAQVGQERLIDESDLSKLPYIHDIIQETLRLYPAAPLLVPHFSSDDCTIGGYHVPRNSIVLVNAWSIHRDPTVWEDPTNFKPERFKNMKIDGHKLMPFGLGRRACPGAGLAQRVVGLTLGSLIQCFDWKRVGEMEVDMNEGEGLSMPKAEPLKVRCKACPIVDKVFP